MKEYYSQKYDVTFTLISGDLYTLVDDEWEPVDWDIVGEDKEMDSDYHDIMTMINDEL